MKKQIIAAVVVAASVVVPAASADAGRPSGRCPQFEHLLVQHGMPVQFFSRIMWRESRCQPGAVNVNRNRSVDRGLMQINSIHLRKTGVAHGMNPNSLFDPAVNIQVAAKLYKRSGTRPWRATGG